MISEEMINLKISIYPCVQTNLSSGFQSLLVFVRSSHYNSHLDEPSDGHKRRYGADHQSQLPGVDKTDDQPGYDTGGGLKQHTQAYPRSLT